MREFVVNKRRRQQALAFTSRHEESETRRKRLPDIITVTESDGDGRRVLDRGAFRGKLSAGDAKHIRGGLTGKGEDYAIEMIGTQTGGDDPPTSPSLNRLHCGVG